ncbi:hypothetical protein Tco_1526476, partial [Tanacetum coccineum]
MGDIGINTLTTEQYLALTRGNQASGVVKPEIEGYWTSSVCSTFQELHMTQSCYMYFPSLSQELRRDWWTDYLQEQLTPRICSKRPSFKGLDTMTRQLLDSQGPISNKMPAQALDAKDWIATRRNDTMGRLAGGFSDEEETEKLEEIKDVIAKYEPTCQKVKPSNLPVVSFYVTPYELPIPFPRRLEQHVVEALVHKAIESL